MGGILKFLSGPVKGLLDGVRGIIDESTTTDEEKLAAKNKLTQIENAFNEQLLDAQTKIAQEQASIIKAEIASQSWLARNWRPIFMLVLIYVVAHNYVIAPLFGVPSVTIVPDMWALLKIGLGGYMTLRSTEKVAPSIIKAIQNR